MVYALLPLRTNGELGINYSLLRPRCPCRYGAVVLDSSSRLPANTTEQPLLDDSDGPGTLAYGVLVNASATHGAPIFMNLVNSAALQAIVDAKGQGADVLTSGGQGVDVLIADDGEVQQQGGGDSGGVGGAARLGARDDTKSVMPRWGDANSEYLVPGTERKKTRVVR